MSSDSGLMALDKIRIFTKQQEVLNVLHSEDPDHYSRLWLVGFLKYVGYSLEDVCIIIREGASWQDYDDRITWLQVKSIFKGARTYRGSSTHESISSPSKQRPGRMIPYCAQFYTPCRDCPDHSAEGCKWAIMGACT